MAADTTPDPVDYSKSTKTVATPATVPVILDPAAPGGVDYSKSTGAFPMEKPAEWVGRDTEIDYTKSTGAVPMYDDRVVQERTVEHIDRVGESSGAVVTPGPVSSGPEQVVTAQRDALGLSPDPSGESDAGYEARPSTIPVPGADGVDRGDPAPARPRRK